jgi:hypothetical protein
MEAADVGAFMLSASVFATLLEYTASPVHQAIPDPFRRRFVIGLTMGLTAVGIRLAGDVREPGSAGIGAGGPLLSGSVQVATVVVQAMAQKKPKDCIRAPERAAADP